MFVVFNVAEGYIYNVECIFKGFIYFLSNKVINLQEVSAHRKSVTEIRNKNYKKSRK